MIHSDNIAKEYKILNFFPSKNSLNRGLLIWNKTLMNVFPMTVLNSYSAQGE